MAASRGCSARVVLIRSKRMFYVRFYGSDASESKINDGRNWVGPQHPVSNLRVMKYGEKPNETQLQKDLRLRRIDVQNWNQKFWEDHNSRFERLKAERVRELSIGRTEAPSADEMSQFYKSFLEDNRIAHAQYNKEWYKRNIGLLWPAIKVVADNLLRKLKRA